MSVILLGYLTFYIRYYKIDLNHKKLVLLWTNFSILLQCGKMEWKGNGLRGEKSDKRESICKNQFVSKCCK